MAWNLNFTNVFQPSSIVKKFPFENTTAQDLICEPIEKNFTSRLLFLPTLFRKEMHFLSFKRTKSYIISYEILKWSTGNSELDSHFFQRSPRIPPNPIHYHLLEPRCCHRLGKTTSRYVFNTPVFLYRCIVR